MKFRAALPYIGAFLLMYGGWLGYFYYRDRIAHPAATLQLPAPAASLSNSMQVNPTQTFTTPTHKPIGDSATIANNIAVEQHPVAIADTRPPQQLTADTSHYNNVQNEDDLPALSALMSDPDPEVARIARDAYNARLEGVR